MVRYPHTAIVSGEIGGEYIKGVFAPGELFEESIKGCYFPSNSGQQLKRNADGAEMIVKGEFSTKAKPIKGVTHIKIDSIGLDERIICWEKFQTHSVIYI
jgi:hypothetical protein